MTIKAAVLDAQNVYWGIDELENEAAITDRHVLSITQCDLPVGRYRWVPDDANPYGGAFWPLPRTAGD